ncbi:hypothetical protein CROQUDRAFT_37942 [Cronartium quercuum f. sp. fusiforme G11]|uniref:Ubiquitin-like domain-containing protein n=1 Tax=Cronartium quercuum f. sp. fusiforme G11 TaxID=708437 RepID=A0A9P6NPB7_9BASI|nr:hypothetical protein CROQUDRAFT_37942 [Cronartium quercuum f. sp. fusiforme G11]
MHPPDSNATNASGSHHSRPESHPDNGLSLSAATEFPSPEGPTIRLTFNIRFAGDGSVSDLCNIWVGDRESVREFKRRVQLLRPELASRRLRFIYLGRVLTDGTLLVPWMNLLLQRQHAQAPSAESVTRAFGDAVSGALGAVKGSYDAAIGVKSKGKAKDLNPLGGARVETETTVWLQCAVGDVLSPTMSSDELVPSVAPTFRPLTGFDRLAEAGFSEEDIDQVRQQFYAEHNLIPPGEQGVGAQEDADQDEHARAMEEQWLEGLNPAQDNLESGFGSQIYTTLFRGLCIGFFFPVLPIFFFRTNLMDRRTQLAVISGTAINLLFGMC